jgi:hypothetical protein
MLPDAKIDVVPRNNALSVSLGRQGKFGSQQRYLRKKREQQYL